MVDSSLLNQGEFYAFLWAVFGGGITFVGTLIAMSFKSGKYIKQSEQTAEKIGKIGNIIWDEEGNMKMMTSVDCEKEQNRCSSDVGMIMMTNKRELEQKIDGIKESLKSDLDHLKELFDELKVDNDRQAAQFNKYVQQTSEILGGLKEAVEIIKDWKKNGNSHH
ncbi:MAG: hypothetical protein ACTSVK_07735 [Promethearchaeota archaeon]